MTAIDPGAHAASPAETEPTAAEYDHDWAQYAAQLFDAQKRAGVAVTIDTQIASELAATFETREQRYDMQALTTAIRDLERVVADHTATIRASLAAKEQADRFPQEIAEDAQRAAEEGSG